MHRLLEEVALPGGQWLEPSAGDGAIVRATNGVRNDVDWLTVEIRSQCRHTLVDLVGERNVVLGDFLAVRPRRFRRRLSVVLSNPPFSLALPVIEHAMMFNPSYVVMLLRLNFLASNERSGFMRMHAPDVYVLPNRPSFSGRGTDSIEYAWFVWHGQRRRSNGQMRVLAPTNQAERCVPR